MGEKVSERELFDRTEQTLKTLKKTGDFNTAQLAHLMNSYDRLYTKRYEEYRLLTDQHHELSASRTKRETELRRLVEKYEKLRSVNEEQEKNTISSLVTGTFKALTRFLPGNKE